MRTLLLPFVVLIGCSTSHKPAPPPATAEMRHDNDAISKLHHPVSTNVAAAQRQFDEGLTLIYAFNHDAAIASFRKSLDADPKLAMAHWGIALALGPNYNVDVDPAREKQAYDEMQKATELSQNASQAERDYIAALSKRFSGDEKPDLKMLAHSYADAMRRLMEKYPDDLDAATLYADAMMCLRPWQLYSLSGEPAEGTDQIVAALESVLKRDPDHIGANHLYIHAVEASSQPERAMEAAARLPGLAPSCGHLVHMPSHIYSRVGDYDSAATSNEAAIAADQDYFAANPSMAGGLYAMMYYSHNIHFLAYAAAEEGNYAIAKKWSGVLVDHVTPHVHHMQMLEAFLTVPYGIEVRFHKWDDCLAEPVPESITTPRTSAISHFARGMAYAGKGDTDAASREATALAAETDAMPTDMQFAMVNKAHDVMTIARKTLAAKIARQKKQFDQAEQLLRQAVELQDKLNYIEPPDWLLNSREMLGSVLLAKGDAAGAEKVFRDNLDRNPRSGRSLFGLQTALEKQGNTYEAGLVQARFETAWKNADIKLSADDL